MISSWMNKNIGKKNYDEKIPFATPTNGMTQFIQQALISFFVLVTVLENILRSIVLLPFLEGVKELDYLSDT